MNWAFCKNDKMNTSELIKKYESLNLNQVLDYNKFSLYSITNHSTVIEGSTLTANETQLLLEEDLTPKGKPLEHTLMTKDHHNALLFTIDLAKSKKPISTEILQEINSKVMKSTGKIYNTALGNIDATKGDLRKINVFVGSRYFPNYDKVPKLINDFCVELNKMIKESKNNKIELLKISFWAHFNLVSIHPFADGNGRTSRLLMNYIQEYLKLPLSIVFKEDKIEYFDALEKARDDNNISHFYDFLLNQYDKHLSAEIDKFNNKSQGFNFLF